MAWLAVAICAIVVSSAAGQVLWSQVSFTRWRMEERGRGGEEREWKREGVDRSVVLFVDLSV